MYLIVNLVNRQVESLTDPDAAAQPHPTYRRREAFRSGSFPLALPGHELKSVMVDALLPPQA